MGQAIVYQDTPRPSLTDMSDEGEGYGTVPKTPVLADGGDSWLCAFKLRYAQVDVSCAMGPRS